MIQNFKYLTHSEEDKHWGLYANVSGFAQINIKEIYPPEGHPDEYFFQWNQGRILDEFQLIYITEGEGIFETKHKTYQIKAGNIILLFPNEWHRYRPLHETGWTENYIGFSGEIAKNSMSFFKKNDPVQYIGFNESIVNSFKSISQLAQEETSGFQQVISGHILFILGKMRQIILNKSFANTPIEKTINQSRIYMRDHLSEHINLEELADMLNISYSQFRGSFKKYTGISPGQYLLQLKLQKAKNLLVNSTQNIKEISFNSGFESPFYFSKVFKKHIGISPSDFREKFN